MREIPFSEPSVTDAERNAVAEALSGAKPWSWWLDAFAERVCEKTGTKFCIPTSSGTGALHLAMLAHGIGPGDEVIMPELTWVAARSAIHYVGATPVFADITPDTWCIDPADVIRKLTPKTKAIVPVHTYGHPVEMNALRAAARSVGVVVIEDAAPALGSTYLGMPCGCLGDSAAFSFHYAKIVTTGGEGGAFVTNDERVYQKALYYANHCRDGGGFHCSGTGVKYKMSTPQAAFGWAQLGRLDDLVDRRRAIFQRYYNHLAKNCGDDTFIMNTGAPGCYWNGYVPCMVFAHGDMRTRVMNALAAKGMAARTFFGHLDDPLEIEEMYEMYPVSFCVDNGGMNLPCPATLTDEEIDYICEVIKGEL